MPMGMLTAAIDYLATLCKYLMNLQSSNFGVYEAQPGTAGVDQHMG